MANLNKDQLTTQLSTATIDQLKAVSSVRGTKEGSLAQMRNNIKLSLQRLSGTDDTGVPDSIFASASTTTTTTSSPVPSATHEEWAPPTMSPPPSLTPPSPAAPPSSTIDQTASVNGLVFPTWAVIVMLISVVLMTIFGIFALATMALIWIVAMMASALIIGIVIVIMLVGGNES